MEAPVLSTRELFTDAVRAVLETWPVLQIAVDNGFGGTFSQQKADWMVDVVRQYFQENADLQQYEVEDFLADLMNNEFDTVVDDGSLPQVASQMCLLFKQCQQGKMSEVKGQIDQLTQKKSTGRVKATPAQAPKHEEEDSEEEAEAMECESATVAKSSSASAVEQEPVHPSTEAEDGWTVVRKKK